MLCRSGQKLLPGLKVLLSQLQPSRSHLPPRPSPFIQPERMPRAVCSAAQLWRKVCTMLRE